MQFIPGTWRSWGADGNGDGRKDPHNIHDAALAAGRYLCAGDRDLTGSAQLRAAVLSYNHSDAYLRTVLAWFDFYRKGAHAVPDGEGVLPTSPGAGGADRRRARDGSGGKDRRDKSDKNDKSKSKEKGRGGATPGRGNPGSGTPGGGGGAEPGGGPSPRPTGSASGSPDPGRLRDSGGWFRRVAGLPAGFRIAAARPDEVPVTVAHTDSDRYRRALWERSGRLTRGVPRERAGDPLTGALPRGSGR